MQMGPDHVTRARSRRAIGLVAVAALFLGCSAPAAPKRPGAIAPAASPRPAARPSADGPPALAVGGLRGRVTGPDGLPAAGVVVRAFVVANNGGGVVAAGRPAGYALRQVAGEARTGPDGRFAMPPPAGKVNLEAALRDDLKAFVPEPSAAEELEMRLKKTGRIAGRVATPDGSGVSDLTGADVFVPGSSYVGKADRDGNFVLSGVPEGTFEVVVAKGGVGRAAATGVAVRPEQTTTIGPLTLRREPPTIARLVPEVIAPGKPLIIEGANFGAATGDALRVIVDGFVAATPERLDDGRIRIVVPDRVATGEVIVGVDGLDSAPATARVLTKLEATAWVTGPLRVGETSFMSWRTLDGDGREVTDLAPTWTVAGDAVEVRAGRLVGRKAGVAMVKAAVGPLEAEVAVTVTDGRVLRTFIGYPEPAFAADEGALDAMYARFVHQIFTPAAPAPGAAFGKPYGLAMRAGKLYVGQRDYVGVAEVDLAAGTIGVLKGTEAARTSNIATSMLALSPAGEVHLTNWPSHNAMYKIVGGQPVHLAGVDEQREVVDGPPGTARTRMPLYLAAAADGTVYFCDEDQGVVRALRPDGSIETIAGAAGQLGYADGAGTDARFDRLRDLELDAQGRLVVLDHGNRMLRRIDLRDPTHPVSRWTGRVGTWAYKPGGPDETGFRSLACVELDPAGNAFVTDGTDNYVVKVAPDGSTTAFAGNGDGQSKDGVIGPALGDAATRLPVGLALDAGRGVMVVTEYESPYLRVIRF